MTTVSLSLCERTHVTDLNSIIEMFIGRFVCILYMLEMSHKILLYSFELLCMVSCDVSGEQKSLNSAQLRFPD